MARIPIKPIVDIAKTHGPKAGKFVKKNWKYIPKVVAGVGTVSENFSAFKENKKETKQYDAKMHYRKNRYIKYKNEILPELDKKKRHELFQAKLEVEQFIQQIKNEENKELVVKKPLHSKRINNWNEVLIQIKDKIETRDYQEYLMVYNSTDYHSAYFEGFEGHLVKFKNLLDASNIDEIYNYLLATTKRKREEIERDFSL
ncbi:MAG: hypothetical protein ACQEWE_05985 [Bacillota bacterium]